MADLAYRTRVTAQSWSTINTWEVYQSGGTPIASSTGTWSGGTWATATLDYPKTGDSVWIQSSHVITYDATAISVNNGGTFRQISGRTDASGGLVAQPIGGTGGLNISTGYIALSVANATTIKANYYAPHSAPSNSLFYITASSTTYVFEGIVIQPTTGGFGRVTTGTGNNITLTSSSNIQAGTGGTSARIFFIETNNNIVVVNANINAAASDGISFSSSTGNNITINGNITGSDNSASVFGLVCGNTSGQNTITVAGDCYAGTLSPAIQVSTPNSTNQVTISGSSRIIRNYGATGTNYVTAILAPSIVIPSTTTIYYKTSDSGNLPFTSTGGGSVSPADFWGYALSQPAFSASNSIGKKLKDWALGTDNKVLLSADPQTGVTIPTVTTVGSVSGSVNSVVTSVGSIATNGITTNSFATGAIKNTSFASGAIDASAIASNAITAAKFASGAIDATALATDAVNEIRDAIWNEFQNNTLSLSKVTRLHNASTVQTTGDQLASYNT